MVGVFRLFCYIAAVDFYNDICMLFGIISDDCKAEKCPNMSAGSKFFLSHPAIL